MVGLIKRLQATIRQYQDRCGPPNREDLCGRGVTKSEILRYLKQRSTTGFWACETPDTGEARAVARTCQSPDWYCYDDENNVIARLETTHPDVMIRDLAEIEGRSPWAVLDEVDPGR